MPRINPWPGGPAFTPSTRQFQQEVIQAGSPYPWPLNPGVRVTGTLVNAKNQPLARRPGVHPLHSAISAGGDPGRKPLPLAPQSWGPGDGNVSQCQESTPGPAARRSPPPLGNFSRRESRPDAPTTGPSVSRTG